MAVIKGTKDRKQYQVLRGITDTRKIRCKRCQGLALEVPDGKGGKILKCSQCDLEFKSISLD
jgi:hypothetical protein